MNASSLQPTAIFHFLTRKTWGEKFMSTMVNIDPVTRIEGHLGIRLEIESGQVKSAYSSGEMFRGFEVILKGRDPLDAQQITQRFCSTLIKFLIPMKSQFLKRWCNRDSGL